LILTGRVRGTVFPSSWLIGLYREFPSGIASPESNCGLTNICRTCVAAFSTQLDPSQVADDIERPTSFTSLDNHSHGWHWAQFYRLVINHHTAKYLLCGTGGARQAHKWHNTGRFQIWISSNQFESLLFVKKRLFDSLGKDLVDLLYTHAELSYFVSNFSRGRMILSLFNSQTSARCRDLGDISSTNWVMVYFFLKFRWHGNRGRRSWWNLSDIIQ